MKQPGNLVYIDESGIENTEDYEYGYCKRGERFHSLKSGKKLSMIAALNKKQIMAPSRDIFNAWFESSNFTTWSNLDNASFHKSKKSVILPRCLNSLSSYLFSRF